MCLVCFLFPSPCYHYGMKEVLPCLVGGEPVIGFFPSNCFCYFSLPVVLPVAAPPRRVLRSERCYNRPCFLFCRCFHQLVFHLLRLLSVLPYFPFSFSSFSLSTYGYYISYLFHQNARVSVPVRPARPPARSTTAMHFILAIRFILAICSLYEHFVPSRTLFCLLTMFFPTYTHFIYFVIVVALDFRCVTIVTCSLSGCLTSHLRIYDICTM